MSEKPQTTCPHENTYEHVEGGRYCFDCKKDVDAPENGWFEKQVRIAEEKANAKAN